MGGRALVIGGTGPTGPLIVEGLLDRDFEVTILHGGQHEAEFSVPVRHIHEDPHFAEPLLRGIGSQTFDLVVAQYGRLRVCADVLAGRTARLIAIGGATGIAAPPDDPRWGGAGRPVIVPDDSEILVADEGPGGRNKIGRRMVQAMEAVFEHHAAGDYSATYIAYPLNYGPRTPGPYDWTVIRRALDGRRRIVVADAGQKIESRVFTQNAAAAVLLCIDRPDAAAGRRYSVTDEYAFTMRQRIEFIGRCLDTEFEIIDMPYDVAWPCYPFYRHSPDHRLTTSVAIRDELGYTDAVPAAAGMELSVRWLVDNPPAAGGELEQQIGDPFDYQAEDALIDRWLDWRDRFGKVESPLPAPGHQYRHPKKEGQAWQAATPR